MTISPEALEKARAIALDVFRNAVDSDDGSECMDMPVAIDIIATALQAERDAAAPKLPDDLAGLVAELRDAARLNAGPLGPEARAEHRALTAIQSLVARNAELEAGLKDTAAALRSRLTADELNAAHHKPYEHPLSAYDRAARLLNKDRQP